MAGGEPKAQAKERGPRGSILSVQQRRSPSKGKRRECTLSNRRRLEIGGFKGRNNSRNGGRRSNFRREQKKTGEKRVTKEEKGGKGVKDGRQIRQSPENRESISYGEG